jgi:cytidine deaminase
VKKQIFNMLFCLLGMIAIPGLFAMQGQLEASSCVVNNELSLPSSLSPTELKLIEYAKNQLTDIFVKEKHFVLAALMTKSGKIYSGFNLKTTATRASVCAESIALAKAIESSEHDLELLVVVGYIDQKMTIVSPCGICRELLYDYAPDVKILLLNGGVPYRVSPKELLAFPYKRS